MLELLVRMYAHEVRHGRQGEGEGCAGAAAVCRRVAAAHAFSPATALFTGRVWCGWRAQDVVDDAVERDYVEPNEIMQFASQVWMCVRQDIGVDG